VQSPGFHANRLAAVDPKAPQIGKTGAKQIYPFDGQCPSLTRRKLIQYWQGQGSDKKNGGDYEAIVDHCSKTTQDSSGS
jgi:hypothetical protein